MTTYLDDHWWAYGLTTAERLAGPPAAGVIDDAGVHRRLAAWRDRYGPDVDDRLAAVGADPATLRGLLAESAPALAARVPRPAWAAFVADVVSGVPESADPVPAGSWLDAFAAVLEPFAAAVRDRVARVVPEEKAACDGMAGQLARRLAVPAARTLVLELNVARVRGRLTGATGAERFADFVRGLRGRAGLAALLREYPVLARLVGQACAHAARTQAELLHRYTTDRAAIVATLLGGTDPGPLTGVDTGVGDAHQGGRAVAVLRFADDRRVVYKPRPLDLHAHFTELVCWLNHRVDGLDLRSPAILARDGYGWLEYVTDRPCGSVPGVEAFYRRQGALLALLYAVDASDVHYENLIAAGDQPVLVDVETLFHPDLPRPAVYPDPAADALAASVLRSTLLPQLLVGGHGALDVSGLGGDRGGLFPTDVAGWELPATDEMRFTRGAVTFAGARNRPRLAGRDEDPVDHEGPLLAGFRAGYDAIVRGREEFLGLLGRCAGDETRVVVRPTQAYADLRYESTHPDLLRDALDRDRVLDLLWTTSAGDPVRRRLARSEIADLWAGDVPLFRGRPGSRDLWTSAGERVADALPATGLERTRAKVAAMGEVDRRDQEWVIRAALATRHGGPAHRTGGPGYGRIPPTTPEPTRLLAAACGIADQIVARAVRADGRANWLGLELVDVGWAVRQLGAGLADGYCGVALFLAQIGALTGVARYTELARRALRPVPHLLSALAAGPELAQAVGCGGYGGLAGIAYAAARTATLLGDADSDGDIAAAVDPAVRLAAAALDADGPATVADGAAGCLAAMLAVHAETGSAAARELAGACAGQLAAHVEAGDDGTPAGFATGLAGIGWALLRYADEHDDERCRAAGRTALARALDRGEADTGHAWCTGVSGLLAAHATTTGIPPGLRAAVDLVADGPVPRDLSLCHGELGTAEALLVLDRLGYGVAEHRARRAGLVLSALERYGAYCGVPNGVSTPGLLMGLAGIGYELLRLGFADRVPSALLLEPSSTTKDAEGQ